MATRRKRATPKSRSVRPAKHAYYHSDGTLWGKGQRVDGVMHGYWEWYRKSGVRMRSGWFDHGKQVGVWTTYDAKGKSIKVTTMKPKSA